MALQWTALDESTPSVAVTLEQAMLIADAHGSHGRRVLGAALSACLCGGMGGAMSPFLLGPIAAEAGYEPWAKALFASSLFIGMWIGSFASSAGDLVGPGRLTMLALVSLIGGSVLPVASPSITVVFIARVTVGLSLVVIYQVANTYLAESVRTSVRGAYLSLLHVSIAVGGLAATAIAFAAQSGAWGWRALLLVNTAPAAVIAALITPFVLSHESPRWLLVSGADGACQCMLARIARSAGVAGPLPPVTLQIADSKGVEIHTPVHAPGHAAGAREASDDPTSPPHARTAPAADDFGDGTAGVCSGDGGAVGASSSTRDGGTAGGGSGAGGSLGQARRRVGGTPRTDGGTADGHRHFSLRERWRQLGAMWRLHVTGAVLSFCLNFGAKGSEIWVGTYVEGMGMPTLSVGIYFATISGKIFGDLLNMRLSRTLGRLRSLQLGYFGAAACTITLAMPGVSAALLVISAFCQGLFADIIWCNIYMYLTERFPTTIRSTGFGVSMGIGRAGGVLSSALGGVLPSKHIAFVAFGTAFAVGGVAALCPRVETARRQLHDSTA